MSQYWHSNVHVATRSMCSKAFCMGEPWCSERGCCKSDDSEMEDFQEPKVKKKKLEVASPSRRYADPLSPLKMQRICKEFVSRNTQKATDWARRVFEEWRDNRNKCGKEKCPSTLVENPDVGTLNYWLACFVFEVRWADGEPYPALSLVNILSGLYQYSKKCTPACPNFMDQRDPTFCELNGTLQVKFWELREKGVSTVVKHVPAVLPDEENALWESKTTRDHFPLALQTTVFYYVGKTFCSLPLMFCLYVGWLILLHLL